MRFPDDVQISIAVFARIYQAARQFSSNIMIKLRRSCIALDGKMGHFGFSGAVTR